MALLRREPMRRNGDAGRRLCAHPAEAGPMSASPADPVAALPVLALGERLSAPAAASGWPRAGAASRSWSSKRGSGPALGKVGLTVGGEGDRGS